MYTIFGFYKFKKIKFLKKYKALFQKEILKNNVRGTIILSAEGINGTIAGKNKSVENIIKNLKSKYESLKYIILGDGDEYKNLNKIVSNLKLSDTVDFIQDASQGLKNAILKSSNILSLRNSNIIFTTKVTLLG